MARAAFLMDRLTTMLVLPLMSCGARLPIYALIIPAFFPEAWHAPMLWLIYSIGIALAILGAKLLKMTVLKGETPPFVMELPPYRLPTFKSVGLHMWNRGRAYLRKAGTIILGISILLWALQQWPGLSDEKAAAFAQQREVIEAHVVLSPAEQDEESEPLRDKLRAAYTPLVGFCIMLFCLISAPCMATIAVTRRESNSWKWALFQLGGLTVLAWVITAAVYQVGRLVG